MPQNLVGWLDPSLNSRNSGDQIIAEAVGTQLRDLFPDAEICRIPTQTWLSLKQRSQVAACRHLIVGGTNLLNSDIPRYLQWRIDPDGIRRMRGKVSLLGVGWWQYQPDPNYLSRRIWQSVLNGGVHSVRDGYTQNKLASSGIRSWNTSCVTMWQLPDSMQLGDVRQSVIVTITDYNRDPARDSGMLRRLRGIYDRVVLWPQGAGDIEYMSSLDPDARVLPRQLAAFDEALATGDFDYCGTRLHAGVRALQHGVRALIVAVDNRATEIARCTGLPVAASSLGTVGAAWDMFLNGRTVDLRLPREQIREWRSSFCQHFEI